VLTGGAAAKVGAFLSLIGRLREETARMSLADLVEHVVDRSGLIAHYATEKEGQERIENLRELVNAAVSFAAEEGYGPDLPASLGVAATVAAGLVSSPASDDESDAPSDGALLLAAADAPADPLAPPQLSPLAAFLSHASLEAGESQAGEGQDAVQLMTVHAAKGLEFSAVFITGLEEGLFPHENSVAEVDGLEEERRLMYVAITRARNRLYLSLAQTRMLHGQTRYNLRSRFLEELPERSLKWLTPRVQAAASSHREGWGGAWEGVERSGGWSGRRGADSRGSGGSEPWSDARRLSGSRGVDRDSDVGRADATAVKAAARFDRGVPWRIGQTVAHARFGEGVIVGIEGQGADARVQINFGRAGVKWLALSVARLEPVN